MTTQHIGDPDHQDVLEGLRRGAEDACQLAAMWARRSVTQPRFAVPRDDVEDLVQDTLTQVIGIIRQSGFEIHTSLQAFVRRVAMARTVDHLRRRRPLVELPPGLVSPGVDAIECLGRAEELERVQAALSGLKELCHDLIHWVYFEDQTYRVIAERTGRNVNTLRVHMFKCLQSLRKQLKM